jgi:hypothetical protein
MSNKDQVRLEWKERVTSFRTSGLSMKKWCDQQGVKVHQLQYWCGKYQTLETSNPTKHEWASVNFINESQKLTKPSNLKISIGKCSIEINSEFDTKLLLEVVKVLSETC